MSCDTTATRRDASLSVYYSANMARFPKSSRLAPATLLLSLAVVGCSQTAVRGPVAATAPAISGDSPAHIRGVSDPNAQFTLIDRTKTTSRQPVADGESTGAPCATSSLQVYEVGASMNGENRVIRLAFKNRSDVACSLSGYPGIELQDDKGLPIASIAVHQTGSASLSGTVTTSVENAATSPAVAIVLRPSGAATFEIGWSDGGNCPLVSRIMISMPGAGFMRDSQNTLSGYFTKSHPLNVCGGEVRMSTLVNSGVS